jgi:hypothetical protein
VGVVLVLTASAGPTRPTRAQTNVNGAVELWLARPDATRPVTDDGNAASPWSPDGRALRRGLLVGDIYVADTHGAKPRNAHPDAEGRRAATCSWRPR